MTKQFTTPCLIRKNTRQLKVLLTDMGYMTGEVQPSYGNCIAVYQNVFDYHIAVSVPESSNKIKGLIDCGENEALFLALAAINDSDDKDQWFIRIDTKELYLCKAKKFKCAKNIPGGFYHKATVPEIIEHFKTKEK